MTASRTLIAAARSTRNGFSYNEFETVDADSMIADLAADGYTAWICGEVKIKVAPVQPTAKQKAQVKLAAAKEQADAARSAKLCAAANYGAALISRDDYLAAFSACEKAQADLARARAAYDKVSAI